MKFFKYFLLVSLFSPSASFSDETPYPDRYFTTAGLYSTPATTDESKEITREVARVYEESGKAYYIESYDSKGRPLSLEKRLGSKMFFKYVYSYSDEGGVTKEVIRP